MVQISQPSHQEPSQLSSSIPLQIAIAGAGLAGSLLAWRLLEYGIAGRECRITLFDKGDLRQPRSAAITAAAMISPFSEVVVSERCIFDMGMRSLQLWPNWLEAINAECERPVAFNNAGSIVVAHHSDAAELYQFKNELKYHLKHDDTAQWLTQAELKTLEPDIAGQFGHGLFLPGEAYLDNRQLMKNLHGRIQALGGHCISQAEVKFEPEAHCDHAEFSNQHFDWTFDCRGVGAAQSQNIRGVRGEVLWVQTPEVKLNRAVRLMHPRYKLYIVPKPNNSFIVGATEIESQDASPVSVQSMMELCSALYTLNPAFAEARIVELDANLRPSYLDNLPKIEWHDDYHCASINGLYRHGYLLAPYLIEQFLVAFAERINS